MDRNSFASYNENWRSGNYQIVAVCINYCFDNRLVGKEATEAENIDCDTLAVYQI